MDLKLINTLSLAFLGDAIYEAYIRKSLITKYAKVDELQKRKIEYVSAKGQVKILEDLINNNVLNEDELDIVKKGRNYKRAMHPKNTDIITYKKSTGFEALIGYLYLKDMDRLNEILNYIEVK